MLTRRSLLKTGCACVAGAALTPACVSARKRVPANRDENLPRPTPAQMVWQDCEVGLIYHFDLPTAARWKERSYKVERTFDPALYSPRQLDTDQWIGAATAAGAQYAVFTATHFNGFMQWQSDLYPYGLKQTKWRNGKGDVVADFVESCRKAGIKPGIYFSTHRNVYWTVWGHYVDWGAGRGTEKQKAFNRIAERMTEELCSRYGPLVQIWYDGGVKTPAEGGPDVLPIFEQHQPDSVFYHSRQRSDHRWIGNEGGNVGYPCWATMPGNDISSKAPSWKPLLSNGDPDGTVWSPGMVDVPLRGANNVHSWFWYANEDHGAHSTEKLMQMYDESVGRNCNFIIGEVVAPDGVVPESDITRLTEFGRVIRRRFGSAVGETQGEGELIELEWPRPQRIDHVIVMEDIAHGERIREYAVEGLGRGNEWQELCRGQSVGHKRIQQFTPAEMAKVRLRVTKARARPMIRKLAVYSVSRE